MGDASFKVWLFAVASVVGACSSASVPSVTPGTGDSDEASDAGAPDNGDSVINSGDSAVDNAPRTTAHLRYPVSQTQSPITAEVATNLRTIASADSTRHDDMFMKVGDSISESYAVMSCFADPTTVTLADHTDLEPIIDFYRAANISGPTDCDDNWCANAHTAYNRKSYVAIGGATSRMPLEVREGASDTSLNLEDNAIHPRIALIELGTNDSTIIDQPQKLDDFYANMQAIIATAVQRGLVPVLYTIPPYVPQRAGYLNVPTMNAIVRVIAQGNAVPLIDFNRESLPLPNWGLWDGTHPTQAEGGGCRFDATSLEAGFNVRNLISVEALERVHAVLTGGAAPDAIADVAGDGSAEAPFTIDTLPFVDNGDAAADAVHYSVVLGDATRLRAIAYSADGAANVTVTSAAVAVGGPAHIVQQSLAAGTYDVAVSSGKFDLIVVACDPADSSCN
jgi:hypothetical protein